MLILFNAKSHRNSINQSTLFKCLNTTNTSDKIGKIHELWKYVLNIIHESHGLLTSIVSTTDNIFSMKKYILRPVGLSPIIESNESINHESNKHGIPNK